MYVRMYTCMYVRWPLMHGRAKSRNGTPSLSALPAPQSKAAVGLVCCLGGKSHPSGELAGRADERSLLLRTYLRVHVPCVVYIRTEHSVQFHHTPPQGPPILHAAFFSRLFPSTRPASFLSLSLPQLAHSLILPHFPYLPATEHRIANPTKDLLISRQSASLFVISSCIM